MVVTLRRQIERFTLPLNLPPGSPEHEIAARLSIVATSAIPIWLLALVLGNSFVFVHRLAPTLLILVIEVGALAACALARRGHARPGAWILLALSWTAVTTAVWLAGGPASVVPIYYLVLSAGAAWLLGRSGLLWHTGFSFAAIALMATADAVGPGLPRYFPVPPFSGLLAFSVAMALVTLPMLQVLQSLDASRSKVRELEFAEDALQTTQARYHALFSFVNEAIFVADPETGMLLDANPAAEALVGRSLDEIRTLHHSALNPRDRVDQSRRTFAEQVREPGLVESVLEHRDGRRITVEIASTVWTDSHGKRLWFGLFRDCSGRRKAQEALRKSEEKFATAFRCCPIATVIADLDDEGRAVDVGGAFEKLSGYRREDVLGVHLSSLWCDCLEYAEALRRFRENGRIQDFEFRFRRRDGEVRIGLMSGERIEIDGRRCALILVADVTERAHGEDVLRRSERKYRRLHESITDAVVTVDMAGRILESNPAFQAMLLYTSEELSRLTDRQITSERWHAFEARIVAEQVLAKGYSEVFEKEYVRRDGTVLPVELRRYLFRDEKNQPAGMWAIVRDISERKRAEQVLRNSEQRFRSLFDNSLDAIFLTNADGSVHGANPAACALLGMTEREICGAGRSGLIVEDDRLRAALETRRLTGRTQNELTFVRKDGSRFEGEAGSVVLEEDGRAFVIVRDITERQRAAEALRRSEKKFETLFRCSPVSLTVSDLNDGDRFLEVNEAFEKYTGHSRETAVGRTYPPDWLWVDPLEYAQSVAQFRQSGRLRDFEFRFRRKDGEIRTGILSAEVIEVDDKPCMLATTIDITGRKQAEAALRESTRQLLTVAKCVPDVIWSMDLSGRFTYISPSVARTHRATVEEGLRVNALQTVSPRQAAQDCLLLRQELELAASPEYDPNRVIIFESEQVRKDGSTFWAEINASFIWSDDGRPVGVTGVTRDITERKQALAEHERLRSQLAHAQKLESIGRLAGGIAHDFNNLLSIILLYAESALDGWSGGDNATESIQAIQDAAQRGITMGRQLMAFSHSHASRPEVLDLNSVIAEDQKLLQRLIGENIKLDFLPGPDLRLVKADRGQLDQIILNLAVNSRDAMPEGGSLRIETANMEVDEAAARLEPEARPGSYVRLTARDSGVGMSPETLARAFEPFFTTKAVGKGTGLGLSVVYGIVRQSGGYVRVSSEVGRGTEFRIYLPATALSPRVDLHTASTAPLPHGSERLLLVEDEPALCRKLSQLLEKAGYRVLAAADGDDALRSALQDTQPVDLLLTDVVMPGLSGPQLAQRLKPLRPEMKVLYMSGYPDAGEAAPELQSEPNLIEKPFSEDCLLRRLREVLGQTAGS